MEFNKNMDIDKYIVAKMKEDHAIGIESLYEIRPATGNSIFGDKEIVLVSCEINETCEYEVLEGTSAIGEKYKDTRVFKSTGLASYSRMEIPYSVKLPNTVHTIGYDAFKDTALENINLESVTFIGVSAFRECDKLKFLTIGSKTMQDSYCTLIERYAFENCRNLETVIFQSNVNIESGAFAYCRSLKNINLDRVWCFGEQSFNRCEALEQIDLSGCKSDRIAFALNAFAGCESLREIKWPKNFTFAYHAYFGCFGGKLHVYNVESSHVIWSEYDCPTFNRKEYPIPEEITFHNSNVSQLLSDFTEHMHRTNGYNGCEIVKMTEEDDSYVFTARHKDEYRDDEYIGTTIRIMKDDAYNTEATVVESASGETSLFD